MSQPFASSSTDDKEKGDLDIFLSTLESKLRGPFSSLDLAKSVSTLALRKEGLTPKQFLDQVSQVFNRPDKVVKLRILIGLLGLEPPKKSKSTTGEAAGVDGNDDASNVNPDIHHILQLGQDENEEWVKTISGLVQGIMFQDSSNSRESCRGEHAQELLDKTSKEICQRVEKQVQNQSQAPEFDLNASFAPYRYGMIPKELLSPTMPECINGKNPHFQTRSHAKILQIDEAMDIQRAREEQEHQKHMGGSTSPKHNGGSAAASSAAGIAKPAMPPGYRRTSLVSKIVAKKGAPPKTNMFLKAKKPGMVGSAGNNKSRMLQKTQLRRKGGAQSLLSKSSIKGNATALGGGSSSNNTAATSTAARKGAAASSSGRFAGRFGSGMGTAGRTASRTAGAGGKMAMAGGRSRMKMIDVNEVDTLNKEHAKRDGDFNTNSRSSKKRRILELAKQRGLQNKKAKAGAAENGAAGAGAASKAQEYSVPAEPTGMDNDDDDDDVNDASFLTGQQMSSSDNQQQQQDWQIILNERSNKLSDEDRIRVQQFFESHYNPTPDQPIYKMKIHEQKVNDPTTGQAIKKETFYLELDYNTFTSKQSKKVKQYT